MNHTLKFFSLSSLLLLAACSPSDKSSHSAGINSRQASATTQADLATCERIVSADLADETAHCFSYSPQFRQMIRGAYAATDEFGISLLNADHRFKTQDGTPEVKSVGPAFRENSGIRVPVVMQWPGNAPYTVTWILQRQGGNWLISDLVTSGHEHDNGSLLASLKSLKPR